MKANQKQKILDYINKWGFNNKLSSIYRFRNNTISNKNKRIKGRRLSIYIWMDNKEK